MVGELSHSLLLSPLEHSNVKELVMEVMMDQINSGLYRLFHKAISQSQSTSLRRVVLKTSKESTKLKTVFKESSGAMATSGQ